MTPKIEAVALTLADWENIVVGKDYRDAKDSKDAESLYAYNQEAIRFLNLLADNGYEIVEKEEV